MRKVKSWKNKLYSVVNLKENVEIVVKLVTSHSSARIVLLTMVEIKETELEQIFACNMANRAMTRRVPSSSRRRKRKMAMSVILTVTLTGETTIHKMWFSRRLQRARS
jgi:Fe2+ transport system protein B